MKSNRIQCLLLMLGILQLGSCMNSETSANTPLDACPVADAADVVKDPSDTGVTPKPLKFIKYEVCKDSSNSVRVTIGESGEHTIRLNETNVTEFNGSRRIWIEGPFEDQNEIRIFEGDKLVYRIRFENPI
jgi:hypothetical protein